MSQHPSFSRGGGGAKKNRSVLKRHERVDLLTKRGQWSGSSCIHCLPKTKLEE